MISNTLNAWDSVFAKGKSNSEKIDKQRNNFLVFNLEHVWKKRAKSGYPRLHTGYVDSPFCSGDEHERAQNKQTKRKQYIHQRFQASFLSSARTKSWMRTGWGHLIRSWILARTASKKYATPTYGGKLVPCFQIKKKVTNEHYDQNHSRRPKGGPLGQ